MSTSLMVQLAQQITESVAKIDRYHEEKGIAKPTFEIDTPAKQIYPADIEDARQQVFSATTDLRDLVLGPRDALKVQAESVSASMCFLFRTRPLTRTVCRPSQSAPHL